MKRMIACGLIGIWLVVPAARTLAAPDMSQQDAISAAVLIEAQTGTRLWEKDADTAFAVAGLSKLPAILTLAQSMDDGAIAEQSTVRISERAAGVSGPTAFVEGGEEIAAGELMKAAIMISAGDAITALGEAAYGSESVFCGNIEATLMQIGVTSSASDSLGASIKLSAADLAKLGGAACTSKTFTKYCTLYLDEIRHSDGRDTELVNANRLVHNYAGCNGLLTGSSQTDGYCGVFSASRSGTAFIAVIIGAESAAIRAAAAVELLDYGFANFKLVTLAQQGEAFKSDLPVRSGSIKKVSLLARERVSEILDAQYGTLTKQVNAPEFLEAPFDTQTVLGSVDFFDAAGNEIASIPLYASASAEAYGITDLLKKIACIFVGFSP